MDDAAGMTPLEPAAPAGLELPSQPEVTGVEKLVLKRGNLFLVANGLGDVAPTGARDLGLFQGDTRHLSGWALSVKGGPPLCLSSQRGEDYVAQIDLTVTSLHVGDLLGHEPVNFIHLRRDMLIDEVLVDRMVLTNFLERPVDFWLALAWAADFADVFEIRGARRAARGRTLPPLVEEGRAVLRYDGRDGRRYATEVRVEGCAPDAGGPARLAAFTGSGARIDLRLQPAERVEVAFLVGAGLERGAGRRRLGPDEERPLPPHAPGRGFGERARAAHDAYAAWAAHATRFRSSNERFDAALSQGIADLKALTVHHFGDPVVSAGIPWYTCPFGRDALLTGFEALLANPDVARDALRFLARLQAHDDDPSRDAEPGKIPHELRFGEMAAAGEVPHTPYYGSVDATPLFVVLLCEYERWTADTATVDALWPAAEAALRWIDRADRDGDRLIEYQRRTPLGLENQGWKDSHDGVPFADGTPAEPPIALVEVQGYAIDARRRAADLLERRGRTVDALRLRAAARAQAEALDARLWMEERGTYALALDRHGRQVDAVTSNPGHLLFSAAVPPTRVAQVAASLLGPDMWSGWGIRTLAAGQPAYNPLSYHDGTVWPHDNAICAMGLSTHGYVRESLQVLTGLWQAAQHFRQLRLPELFCGLPRDVGRFPVHYPVACSPQAWASAAWFLLLRAALGLHPDAPAGVLHVVSPQLPPWLDELVLAGVRVGAARATLRFQRGPKGASAEVVELEGGPLRVRVEL